MVLIYRGSKIFHYLQTLATRFLGGSIHLPICRCRLLRRESEKPRWIHSLGRLYRNQLLVDKLLLYNCDCRWLSRRSSICQDSLRSWLFTVLYWFLLTTSCRWIALLFSYKNLIVCSYKDYDSFLQNCQTACKESVVVVAATHSHLSVDPHVLNLASLLVDHVVVVRSSSRDTSGNTLVVPSLFMSQ